MSVSFELPIHYIQNKQSIANSIITDLELAETPQTKSLYEYVFHPTDVFSKKTIPLWSQYYTSDKDFLKDTQELLKQIDKQKAEQKAEEKIKRLDEVKVDEVWQEIKTETGFMEKYHYMDWDMFAEFNNSSKFLQILSLYNMTSPVLSLIMPIFFIILPFFILKLQGQPVTSEKYIELLKHIFRNHHLGQIFNLSEASADKLMYISVTIVLYVLQIYQNCMSCIKFYKNMEKIHEQIFVMRDYIDQTLITMEKFKEKIRSLGTYKPFMEKMQHHFDILKHIQKEFQLITPNKAGIKKLFQVGHIMKCFYQLYKNKVYHETLEYSFGFNGYHSNLLGLVKNIQEKKMALCKFNRSKDKSSKDKSSKDKSSKDNDNKNTKFKGAYFPALVNANPVKNTYDLSKNILITGPNAAGKTTLLKATLFNIIISQQLGCGFYNSANISLYDMIHSYINIPDTSGRDSLFQSEARRCKTIIDNIKNKGKKERHFCIFDELYSGTNPYEAIGSAYAFLTYLNKYDNVTFMLTTHFLDLCKRLDTESKVLNCNMVINSRKTAGAGTSVAGTSANKVGAGTSVAGTSVAGTNEQNSDEYTFEYTYKLQKGISDIKGGIKVLKDLDYPKEIIENTSRIIKELTL
jgi:hypothetical protein